MYYLKTILIVLFPKLDVKTQDRYTNVKWFISSSFLLLFYVKFLVSLSKVYKHEVTFNSLTDLFYFNRHINIIISLTTVALGVILIHFVIRTQREGPSDLYGRVIYNGFLGLLLVLGIGFKQIEIDYYIGASIFDKHASEIKKQFYGDIDKTEFLKLRMLYGNGEFVESEAHYEILCDLGHAEGCYSYSQYFEKNKGSKHYWSLKRAISIRPNLDKALNNLSWSLLTDPVNNRDEKDISQALKYSRKAIKLKPKNHYYNDTLAYALFLKKDCERAETYQFLALKYLNAEQERKPSSIIKNEYEERLALYDKCQKTK